jgi:hypothetical protein
MRGALGEVKKRKKEQSEGGTRNLKRGTRPFREQSNQSPYSGGKAKKRKAIEGKEKC